MNHGVALFCMVLLSCSSGATVDAGSDAGTCWTSWPRPGPLDECDAGTPGCFSYGGRWHVAALPPGVACNFIPGPFPGDECGCDAGASDGGCAAGLSCVRMLEPNQAGGYDSYYRNVCVTVCSTDSDCIAGKICWGGICDEPVSCLSDSECTQDRCGVCTQELHTMAHHAALVRRPMCMYESACPPGACSGCASNFFNQIYSAALFHTCGN